MPVAVKYKETKESNKKKLALIQEWISSRDYRVALQQTEEKTERQIKDLKEQLTVPVEVLNKAFTI